MKMDGRKRTQSAQHEIRRIAVARLAEGESPSEVAESLGVSRTSVYHWRDAYERGGDAALTPRKKTGRPRTFTPEEEEQVRRWIQGKDPRQYGFDFGLWTRLIVQEMVRERLGHELSVTSVGRLLHRIGVTPQKPLQRAYERDPEAVAKWVTETYPALKKRATRTNARIFFLDEAGFRSDEPRGRTWGVRGETPVLAKPGNRQSINAISAVTAEGHFWWDTFKGSLNATRFEEFLRAFMKHRRRPVFLVLDGHPSHRSTRIKKLVQELEGRLELHFLPGYAPDLNPDEFVWQHLKTNGTRATPLHEDESIVTRVRRELARLQERPSLLRAFFRAPTVKYILDS